MYCDLQLQNFLAYSDAPIVDLRPLQDFKLGHIKNAAHLPAEQILDRLHELPPRHSCLRLVGSDKQIDEMAKELQNRDYHIVAKLDWSAQHRDLLQEVDLLDSGEYGVRLWQPAPIVARFVAQYPLALQQKKSALDIGCGAGRDAIYLALRGWQVSAIDYLPATLQKLDAFAEYQQVSIESYLIDLEKEEHALAQIDENFDLIVVVRYLHRPLLNQIREKIKPGGFIVYQTFMTGCELFGKPKNPRFLLKAGELSGVFHSFRIIVDEVECLDDGRPTNIFIAQRIE